MKENLSLKQKRKSSGDEILAKKQIEAENAYNPEGFYINNFN